MHIDLGYFEGFLGMDVVLISGDSDGLRALAGLLRSLGAPHAQPIAFHRLPFVAVHHGVELTAHPVNQDRGVRRIKPHREPRFEWHHSQEGWLEAAEKILPVAESGAGHNFLPCIGVEDATIMVSAGEYDEGWWRRHG